MKRREFITLLGGAAAWPIAVRAQQGGERRIGVLMGMVENDPEARLRVAAFRQGLREIGWTESRNIHIEFRWAGDEPKLARAYAAELVGAAPEIIVAHAAMTVAAVQQQTRSLPIVFVQVADPVGQGFIASFAQPGGNTTGFVSFEELHQREMVGAAQGACSPGEPGGNHSRPDEGLVLSIPDESDRNSGGVPQGSIDGS